MESPNRHRLAVHRPATCPIADIDDAIDSLEDEVLMASSAALRADLWQLRWVAIALRRYIAPQREAMSRLPSERVGFIDMHDAQRLREVADRIIRYVEDLMRRANGRPLFRTSSPRGLPSR